MSSPEAHSSPSEAVGAKSPSLSPQEQYVRALAKTLVADGERALRAAVVVDSSAAHADGGKQADRLFYAIWTSARLLLVRTRRNPETLAPKRMNAGLVEYSRDVVRDVQGEESDGVGTLRLQLDGGRELALRVDFSEACMSGQRRFFDALTAACATAESDTPTLTEASSAADVPTLVAAPALNGGPILVDEAVAATSEEPEEVVMAVAADAAAGEAAEAPAEVLLPDNDGQSLTLEQELAVSEGMSPDAPVQPAEPYVATATPVGSVPPVVGGELSWSESPAEAYPLVKNDYQPNRQTTLPPPTASKPGKSSNSGLGIVLAIVGSFIVLGVLLGCGGLLLMLSFGTPSSRSRATRFPSSASSRVPTRMRTPSIPTTPTYEPPKMPSFQPRPMPSVQPPSSPSYQPPSMPSSGRGGFDGRSSAEKMMEDMRRRHEQTMREHEQRFQQQIEESNRRTRETLERMRRGYP